MSRARLDTHFEKAEDSPGFMLWKASNLLQRLHSNCLKDLNITPTQFSLMCCVVYLHQFGVVTSAMIVEQTGMDKMMVSDLVKTLLKKKLLLKSKNNEDGRSFLITPSSIGLKITNQSIRLVEDLDTQFFKKLKNIENFRQELISIVSGNLKEP